MPFQSKFGGLLTYRTTRSIRVDIWWLGLGFRVIQALIVILIAYYAVQRDAWAYHEVPLGRVNAYGEKTAEFSRIGTTSPAYCSSADHDYVFGGAWSYIRPDCRTLGVSDVVTKGKDSVSFTTSIIETVEHAWPCNDPIKAPFKREDCEEIGAPVVEAGEQCTCEATTVYYVKGVETLFVAFEHGYKTTELPGGNLKGDSSLVDDELDTNVHFSNGTTRVYGAGNSIRLTLAELVSLTGAGSLDATNSIVSDDARGTDNKPKYRTTGMSLTVDLKYNNLVAGQAQINPEVDATLDVDDEAGWAGSGYVVFYVEPPRFDADGTQTLAKMTRYRQGVVVTFRAAGAVYAFSWQYFVNEVLAGYLFLAIAVFVADLVAFNLLPNGVSTVLRAKRAEKVSRMHTFAQLGLKAAVAVKQFQTLDTENRGYIEVKELVAAFGSIPQVSKENALLMAQSVMRQMTAMRTEDPHPDAQDPGRMTFNEFMTLIEGATSLDFDQYVKLVRNVGRFHKIDQHAADAAKEAYDAVASGVDLNASSRRSSSDAGAASTQPAEPVGRLTCYLCTMVFGVPSGARHVRCPRCQTVNSTEAQPAQQHHLPSFLPSFGGHQVAPAPQHQPQHHMPAAQPAQPAQQQQGYINY